MGITLAEPRRKLTESDLDARQRERARTVPMDRCIGDRSAAALQTALLDKRTHVVGWGGAMRPPKPIPTRRSWWVRLREWVREGEQ